MYGCALTLNDEINSVSGGISSIRDGVGNWVDDTFGGGSGIVNFFFNGLQVEDKLDGFILGEKRSELATVQTWRNLFFLLSAVCIALIIFLDKRKGKKSSKISSDDTSHLNEDVNSIESNKNAENKMAPAVAITDGRISLNIDLKQIKNTVKRISWVKVVGIFSIVLWAIASFIFGLPVLFYAESAGVLIFFLLFIGLAFIPAKIAQKKGRDFWTWYVYGIWLWLIAFPHVLFIKKKEASSAAETQGNEQPVPAN